MFRSESWPNLNPCLSYYAGQLMEAVCRDTHLPASPISPSSNLLEGRRGTLGQILSDPVNEELLGGLPRPAARRVVEVANVLWLVLFHRWREKWNQMFCRR